MYNHASRWKVSLLFALGAFLALALSALRMAQDSGKLPRDPFSTAIEEILASPSVFFALAALIAGSISSTGGFLPGTVTARPIRLVGGVFLAALTYPIALLGMIAIALPLLEPMDSENPVPVPQWRYFLSEAAPYFAVFCGGIIIVYLMALAFRIAISKWPRRLWAHALGIALGVPVSTVLIGYPVTRSWEAALITPVIYKMPLVLIVGELFLSLVIASWLWAAAPPDELHSK